MAIRSYADLNRLTASLPGDYFPTTSMLESSGGKYLSNPRSSARGEYQVTGGTFDALRRKYSWANLDDRDDPEQNRAAAALLANENAEIFRRRYGTDPNGAQLYMMHHFGPGGYDRLRSGGNLTESEVKANPVYSGLSGQEVLNLVNSKYQRAAGGAPPRPFVPSGTPQSPAAPMEPSEPMPPPPPMADNLDQQNLMAQLMAANNQPIGPDPNAGPLGRIFGRGGIFGSPEAMLNLAAGFLSTNNIGEGFAKGLQGASGVQQRAQQARQQQIAQNAQLVQFQRQFGLDQRAAQQQDYTNRRLAEAQRLSRIDAEDSKAFRDRQLNLSEQRIREQRVEQGLRQGMTPAQAQAYADGDYSDPAVANLVRRSAEGAESWGAAQEYVDPATGQIYQATTSNRNNRSFFNANTGEQVSSLPQGARPLSTNDPYITQQARASGEWQKSIEQDAQVAQGQLATYDRLSELQSIVGGGTWSDQARRFVTTALGINVGKGTPAEIQEAIALHARNELAAAESQRGLGQLTEAERTIIRKASADVSTDPAAFQRIIEVRRAQAQRAIAGRDAYFGLSEEEFNRVRNDDGYARRWQHNFLKNYQAPAPAPSPAPGPGDGKPPPVRGRSGVKITYD